MKREDIPGYTQYANKSALNLAIWALEEKERIKASKLKTIADKMEDRYRNSKEFKKKKAENRYARRSMTGSVRILYDDLLLEMKHIAKD